MKRGANPRADRAVQLALLCAALVVPVLWLFRGPLFADQVLYFRDISVTYYPDYVYVARWLARGVWPVWHAAADAGAPFLSAYPVDLALLASLGAPATLALSPPLHLLLTMAGTYRLARDLERSRVAAATASGVLGLSGLTLSSVLYPNFLAGAWMPWIVWRARVCVRGPSPGNAAALGVLAALQLSTFGGEVALQTALLALVLAPRLPGRRELGALAGAGVLAALLAAPALLGLHALLQGSERGSGFSAAQGLAYSAHPAVLVESALPRFFGDVHTMTNSGYWGQPFYPSGNPYYLSLYLGPALLLAAFGRDLRFAALALLGVLASLGEAGPLEAVMAPLLSVLRGPVKFFYLATVACAFLAADAYDRIAERGSVRSRRAILAPGAALLVLAAASALHPDGVAALVGAALPRAEEARMSEVIADQWPAALAATGCTVLALGAALAAGGAKLPLAGALVAFELLRVNGGLNAAVDERFYDLRPETARLVGRIEASEPARVFSYGVANSPPLRWAPALLSINSDRWLFYMDRQSLLPRTHVLDGLDGAYDLDRMGWAPAGATLSVAEYTPLRFREHRFRLLLASVRWVFSFHPLPEDAATLVAEARFPELREPLRLYELEGALPRAFWVPRLEVGPPVAFDPRQAARVDDVPSIPLPEGRDASGPAPPRVVLERPSPHRVHLDLDTPPGFVVVTEGHHPAWRATGPDGPVPVLRANGRYWALPTPGGPRRVQVRYEPPWRAPAFALSACGLVALALLASAGARWR